MFVHLAWVADALMHPEKVSILKAASETQGTNGGGKASENITLCGASPSVISITPKVNNSGDYKKLDGARPSSLQT